VASISRILKSKGFKVTAVKIDPYINVDAGTMNPIEHGEIFVTDDGDECDQDIGNYERFLDENMSRANYITTGRVYQAVINRERNLEYGGRCVEVVPDIPNEVISRIQKAAKKAYKIIGCSGIARVDFLYDKKTKKWYANEINTLPGTLYHHLWKKTGIEFEDLLKKLISFAEEKYQKKKQITYTFNSNILTQASSNKLSLKGV